MPTSNWFRRTTWTDDDQRDFFARLARARRSNRPQYMCIQSVHLLQTGVRGNVQAALDLLDHCLAEYPPSTTELENLHHIRARCFERLGQVDAAIDAYRLALQARHDATNVRTSAPVDFAFLVVREHRTDLYAEVMGVLNEHVLSADLLFPDAQYRYCAACAIVAQEAGEMERAKEFAAKALQAASRTDSGLSHHPGIGLVKNRDKGIAASLKKILRPEPSGWLHSKR